MPTAAVGGAGRKGRTAVISVAICASFVLFFLL
jgi:hypothetical protein